VKKAKQTKKTKKRYEKPTLTSEPIFETLALACGGSFAKEPPEVGGSCTKVPQQYT
jgi:hypothetical protein